MHTRHVYLQLLLLLISVNPVTVQRRPSGQRPFTVFPQSLSPYIPSLLGECLTIFVAAQKGELGKAKAAGHSACSEQEARIMKRFVWKAVSHRSKVSERNDFCDVNFDGCRRSVLTLGLTTNTSTRRIVPMSWYFLSVRER